MYAKDISKKVRTVKRTKAENSAASSSTISLVISFGCFLYPYGVNAPMNSPFSAFVLFTVLTFLAVNDGVDTFSKTNNNDIGPFLAVVNDMYAKDISKY